MNKYDRNKQVKPIIPVTKIIVKPKVLPSQESDVIRLRFLERPMRWHRNLSYHWQAFIKTVWLSFVLVYPSYWLVMRISKNHSHAEVMGRMNEGYTSDELKLQIRSYKQRQSEGKVETYKDKTGEELQEGNLGLSKMQEELEALKKEERARQEANPTGWHIVQEEKNAFGLLKKKHKGENIQ